MLRYTEKRTSNGLEVKFLRLFESVRPNKKSVQFQPDGICLVNCFFGIPIRRKWFDRCDVYGFGYVIDDRSHEEMLQFNCVGQGQVVLVKNVLEPEAANFVSYLRQQGFAYNVSWELPLKDSRRIFG